jgi:hypothetical protein
MELQMLWLCSGRLTLADNGLQLYLVADLEAQKLNYSQN